MFQETRTSKTVFLIYPLIMQHIYSRRQRPMKPWVVFQRSVFILKGQHVPDIKSFTFLGKWKFIVLIEVILNLLFGNK